MLELHQGQGLDILWRDSHICPSEEEYKMMVNKSIYIFTRDVTINLQIITNDFQS